MLGVPHFSPLCHFYDLEEGIAFICFCTAFPKLCPDKSLWELEEYT